MKIRPYSDQDQQAIIELWRSCDLVKPWNDPLKDIARKLSVDPNRFLVGQQDDQIVASIMIGFDGHRGWLNYLAVLPTHRRCGYGGCLMALAESILKKDGCSKLNLQIRTCNQDVIDFYRSILEIHVSKRKQIIIFRGVTQIQLHKQDAGTGS
jgi:ribosomal protein S18 acetylase RimI-like enzyme